MSVSEAAALRFERLGESHLPDILEIEKEAYPEPWTVGMFRDEIDHVRSQFIVALRQGEIIGYGGFWPVLDEAHITSVTVKESERGHGYGRVLLRQLLDMAKRNGAASATLEVRESNTRAKNMYESFGFRITGRRKRYYPSTDEDALIMTMSLMD